MENQNSRRSEFSKVIACSRVLRAETEAEAVIRPTTIASLVFKTEED
jgi:hypothetical protein